MKSTLKRITRYLPILVFLLLANQSSAFYDASVQRWVNRDPINEQGGRNLYAFVKNMPIAHVDRLGLDLYVCTNPAFPEAFPGSRHAFFWRDDGGVPASCSKQGISGAGKTVSPEDQGPPDSEAGYWTDSETWVNPDSKTICKKVTSDPQKTTDVFKCCGDTANNGGYGIFTWRGWEDCHTPVKNCLKDNELSDRGHPRWDHTYDGPPIHPKPPKAGKL